MNVKETLGRITDDIKRNSTSEEGSKQSPAMDVLRKVVESVKRHIDKGWKPQIFKMKKSRFSLFQDLLSSAISFNHLVTLSKLLQQWPGFQSLRDQTVDCNPWMMLLESMTQDSDFKSQVAIFLEIIGLKECNIHLNQEDVEKIYQILSSLELLAGWKVILLCGQDSLYQQIVLDLKNVTEVSICDTQLLELIISRKLSCRIVETVFYPHLVEHILQMRTKRANQRSPEQRNELNQNGYQVEGAALLLQFRGIHPMFHTLDAAFSVVSKWFPKR
ncbi:putative neuroblastoma-amplified sequence-like [Apostichopus japonicus]|uniref:Putative neuroblastoma-amplified sequence-like n=1 Tax=Stichopus japonicus TaxID=307972 RepID=A0A2G8LGN9_STIJA|nr:putative neuroblastoma-amplified sequence-like [Apostichopus japonicus]